MKISDLKIAVARKKLLALAEDSAVAGRARKMGIILDAEDENALAAFLRLKQDLSLEQEDFRLVSCSEKSDKEPVFDIPVISRKDLGWNGRAGEEVLAFLGAEYDVLVSFTASENKLSHFLVSVSRARLKVGRLKEDKKGIFDLNISAELSSPEIFISELKKYLKILNTTT